MRYINQIRFHFYFVSKTLPRVNCFNTHTPSTYKRTSFFLFYKITTMCVVCDVSSSIFKLYVCVVCAHIR